MAIKTAGAPRKDSSLQIDQSLPPLGSNIPFPKMRLHQLFLGWHPKGLEQRLLRRNGKTKLASSSTPLDFEVFPKYIIINSLVIYPYSHPMKLPWKTTKNKIKSARSRCSMSPRCRPTQRKSMAWGKTCWSHWGGETCEILTYTEWDPNIISWFVISGP